MQLLEKLREFLWGPKKPDPEPSAEAKEEVLSEIAKKIGQDARRHRLEVEDENLPPDVEQPSLPEE